MLENIVIYHRMGFKCEHVIIAIWDFSPSLQSLERYVYITHICTYVHADVINA